MTGNHPLSPIHLQIMWDRLIAVVEEQATTLVRTGFSTSTREAGDVSAGVFDQQGDMLAQAVTGTPGHVNSMARSVLHFLDKFPAAALATCTTSPWSRRPFIGGGWWRCSPAPATSSISAAAA
jgi:N-methylhydantoinase B